MVKLFAEIHFTQTGKWLIENFFVKIDEGIALTIREYSKPSFTQAVITLASNHDKGVVLDDLYSIPLEMPDKKLLEMAVYGANGFKIDQVFLLYQLDKLNYRPENNILQVYSNKLKEKYRFELFDFHK